MGPHTKNCFTTLKTNTRLPMQNNTCLVGTCLYSVGTHQVNVLKSFCDYEQGDLFYSMGLHTKNCFTLVKNTVPLTFHD